MFKKLGVLLICLLAVVASAFYIYFFSKPGFKVATILEYKYSWVDILIVEKIENKVYVAALRNDPNLDPKTISKEEVSSFIKDFKVVTYNAYKDDPNVTLLVLVLTDWTEDKKEVFIAYFGMTETIEVEKFGKDATILIYKVGKLLNPEKMIWRGRFRK